MVTGLENVLGRSTRVTGHGGNRFSLPDPPKALKELQDAAARKHPSHAWTGVSYVAGGAKDDVKDYLGDERDASRTMVSTNVDTWVMRHSYHTGEPMHAFLANDPPGGKLTINLTQTPSWHANAPGASSFASALRAAPKDADGFPQLDKDFVKQAIEKNPSFKKACEEIGDLADVAENFVDSYDGYASEMKQIFSLVEQYDASTPAEQQQIDGWLSGMNVTMDDLRGMKFKPADANELLGELANDLGTTAMGEKFSKENVYNMVIKLPDGKTIKKQYDVTGKETTQRFVRENQAYHATSSPDVDIDISQYKGKTIVVTGWPNGSAGVGGYREARETHIHIPN
jgi:hypothetical protein